jgi:hypothetical protein
MSVNRLLANLAQSLDSSSVGSFLSGDSADRFQTLQWTDVSGRPTVADSATTISIIDSAYVQSRVTTYTVGLDSATTITLLDSDYISSKVTNDVGFFIYHYDTTAGQTLLDSSNEASNNAISYTEDYVMVFKNGVLLSDTDDYTANTGNTISLTSGADSGELVTVVKWSPGSSGGISFQGTRGHVGGGYAEVNTQNADYFDITTPGNATTFGLLTVKRGPLCGFGDGTYAVYAGGANDINTSRNTIDYFTIASIADAVDFGDLIDARGWFGGTSNGTYGLMAGGKDWGYGSTNAIEYVTIASPSNASDFGDLTVARSGNTGHCDGTYAIFGGGTNVIDYVTAATPSNATDFGDLTSSRADMGGSGANDATYAVYSGGGGVNTMDYITMATPSNATDFGDQSVQRNGAAGVSDGTYGVFCGGGNGNVMDYVTITVPANAVDFGDMANGGYYKSGCSGSPS